MSLNDVNIVSQQINEVVEITVISNDETTINVNETREVVNIVVEEKAGDTIIVQENIEVINLQVVENVEKVTVKVSEFGLQGARGLSAYEIAVKNGFEGTEVEWLESLAPVTMQGGIIF